MTNHKSHRPGWAVAAAAFCVTSTSFAADSYLGGRVRQGLSMALDPARGEDSVGPSQWLVELQGAWKPTDTLTFTGDLWIRGDWFYDLNDGRIQGSGIQNALAGPPFRGQFPFELSRESGATAPFGDDGDRQRIFDDFDDDILRELSLGYADPDGRFGLKIGKFQRGWGQADGLRLLDILYPQDLRQRSVFTDTEDMRLPAWSAALDLNIGNTAASRAFEAIGMRNATLELLYIPEVRHSDFVINNPTPSDEASGGIFGFPFPMLADGTTGFGLPLLAANLNDVDFDEFDSEELAARLKFEAFGGEMTLNAFYGYQDLPIVELAGAELIIGNPVNDPSLPGAIVVPLDVPTTIGAVHAPGGFVDFIQSIANGTVAPGTFPLIPFGCNDILVAPANCSVNANFDLNYTYRQKVVGTSFTRDIRELKLGPKEVSPVLRMELSYEFDKPFNRGVVQTPFGEQVTGSAAMIGTLDAIVTERDVISVLLGVDYNMWLPFWQSQESSLFLTTQFFNIHTENAEGLLWQAPYAFTDVEKNWNYLTQTWTLPLANEKLLLDGLLIWDMDKDGLAYRQRIEYAMLGGNLKPRLEWGFFDGQAEQGLFGAFRNSDYIELSVTYQF